MLNQKSSFSLRVLTSIKERIRARSKKTGESINSIAERALILGMREIEKGDKRYER